MIPQGLLNFSCQETDACVTSHAGLMAYLELAIAAGLDKAIDNFVQARTGQQGRTDTEMIFALLLLNLVGYRSVSDIDKLNQDPGLCDLIQQLQPHVHRVKEKKRYRQRWRIPMLRVLPSASAIFDFLSRFHEPTQELLRQPHVAFIPKPNPSLVGLSKVNRQLVTFAQRCQPSHIATIDQDATLVPSKKRKAFFCYQHYKAYQPFNSYWFEKGLLLHSEFRDGNVPAGYEQVRLLKSALDNLPAGVKQVRIRSDTAGYQHDLIQWCAGNNSRYGVIEFTISVDVTPGFKRAVLDIPQTQWHDYVDESNHDYPVPTEQQWAEVNYVPSWVVSNKAPDYRFIAIRKPYQLTDNALPSDVVSVDKEQYYKITGIVTNRDLPGQELIAWHRQRCGDSEQVHHAQKKVLSGGRLPSSDFGENAAWWQIMVIAFNLCVLMSKNILGGVFAHAKIETMRELLINTMGKVTQHAHQLIIKIAANYCHYLVLARQRIIQIAARGPPTIH